MVDRGNPVTDDVSVLFAVPVMILGLSGSVARSNDSAHVFECPLRGAAHGDVAILRGKVAHTSHDLVLRIPGCSEVVLLTYAGSQDTHVSADRLHKDANLDRFREYTTSKYGGTEKDPCIGCFKYDDVEATLTGELEIASVPSGTTKDRMGFLRDATGAIVGKWGWGDPVPFAGFRLTIQSVSDVKARRRSGDRRPPVLKDEQSKQ
jgi:hypothetical protein